MSRAITHDDMILAEEALIADTQFAIHNLLEVKGVSRAELARRLSLSEARISQIFSDDPKNLTLRTIARIFRVLNEEARVTSRTLDEIIPRGDGERPTPPPAASVDRTELTRVWLEEAARVRVAFKAEANDNIVEGELVAA